MSDRINNSEDTREISELLQVRRDKLRDLQERGCDPFQITKYDVSLHTADILGDYAAYEGKIVSLAGRMMSKRVMGKASFCHIQDLKGSIQVYVSRDNLGDASYADFKKLDIGDIIGISGEVFRTKTEEISIRAESITLLSKSLQILHKAFFIFKCRGSRPSEIVSCTDGALYFNE